MMIFHVMMRMIMTRTRLLGQITVSMLMSVIVVVMLLFGEIFRRRIVVATAATVATARRGQTPTTGYAIVRLLESRDQTGRHGRFDHAAVFGRRELDDWLHRLWFHDHREETLGEHARVGLDLGRLRVESCKCCRCSCSCSCSCYCWCHHGALRVVGRRCFVCWHGSTSVRHFG